MEFFISQNNFDSFCEISKFQEVKQSKYFVEHENHSKQSTYEVVSHLSSHLYT